jgi:hypothetical protein
VAAGEHLEPDVAKGVDEQGGSRLGVRGRVQRLALAPEQQLVADDAVAFVGDRLAHDRDVRAARGGIGEDGHLPPWSARRPDR